MTDGRSTSPVRLALLSRLLTRPRRRRCPVAGARTVRPVLGLAPNRSRGGTRRVVSGHHDPLLAGSPLLGPSQVVAADPLANRAGDAS